MMFYTSGLTGFLAIWSSTNRIIRGVLGGEHVLRQNIGKSYDNAEKNQYHLDMKTPHEVDFSWTNLANLSIFHPKPSKLYEMLRSFWKDESPTTLHTFWTFAAGWLSGRNDSNVRGERNVLPCRNDVYILWLVLLQWWTCRESIHCRVHWF